jgi:aminoglycoside phosphotransferase (APT) family kinase protein
MDFRSIVTMCQRAFDTTPLSAVQLTGGHYNTTYRVHLNDDHPVILRIAPEPARQSRIEHALMRNEHASLPFFAPIAAMMPRTLFADFTHDLVNRDYLWQTMLDGIPAATALKTYPRPQWTDFYRQLGTITRSVHDVRGHRFGPVAGPTFATWSEAVLTSLTNTVADLTDAHLDADDLIDVASTATHHQSVLDEITEPRLLHGDLWIPNLMLAEDSLTITGVLDHDRASWGDPEADWTIFVLNQKAAPERATFWDTYGLPSDDPNATWRSLIYQAVHIGAIRLERHRLGKHAKIPASYDEMREILKLLAS